MLEEIQFLQAIVGDAMKLTLDEFLAQNKPAGRSKLDRFSHEIFELKNQGFSLDQILDFLRMNDLKVTKPTLHYFIKKRTSTNQEPSRKHAIDNQNKKEMNQIKNEMAPKTEKTAPEKPKSDWTPPPWAPKDFNIDDYV